jgi:cysteinyl-tRNA synthetase
MMELQLHNTLTRKKESFTPLNPREVKMYVCGPTVYDRAHIGNARSVVVYDQLYRLLRHLYGPEQVLYVRNITDVDDKINIRAKEQGVTIQALTSEVTGWFHADMAALNTLPPNVEPRATENIPQMIAIIERLIARGHAYAAEGHVLFHVPSDPHYGCLSRRNRDEMVAGARVEVAPFKKDPADFVLWKPADAEDDPSSIFESPWGKGRPGWHIECSAMSSRYLGNDFDLHGGGADLMFPHHENEIAQSTCANEGSHFARYWVHNGFLTVNGEKMSKSLGNFITVRELLDRNIPGEAIRYVLLSTHYRKPLDWSEKAAEDALKSLDMFYSLLADYENDHKFFNYPSLEAMVHSEAFAETSTRDMVELLCNDLNTPAALALMHQTARALKQSQGRERERYYKQLRLYGMVMGLLRSDARSWLEKRGLLAAPVDVPAAVQQLAEQRLQAKLAKHWAEADRLRDAIRAEGFEVVDKPGNTYALEPVKP